MTRLSYLAAALFLAAPGATRAATSTAVTIPRIEGQEIAVDGVLDEPAWERAARLEGFHQYQPVDGRPAAEKTDLLLSYEPTPGTVAFLGYGSSLDNGESFGFDSLARQSDGFFLKLADRFRR